MSTVLQLSQVERSELEDRAARIYVEVQRQIEKLNQVGDRLRTGGVVPQLSAGLDGWISPDPFHVQDLGNNLSIRSSHFQRPATKKGKQLWDHSSAAYGRPPNVVHRTRQGYIAVFERDGAMPLYK